MNMFCYVLLSNANLMTSVNFFNNGRGGNLNYKKYFSDTQVDRFVCLSGLAGAKPRAADHKAYKERLHHYELMLGSI